MRFYRLSYNIFSVISFAPILWLMVILPDQVLYQIPVPWIYLSLAGQVAAIVLLVVGVLQTDTLSFVGLRAAFRGERTLITIGQTRILSLGATSALYSWFTLYLVDACHERKFFDCYPFSYPLHNRGGFI